MKKNLRILTITHMFPSRQLKSHGIFFCRQAQYLAGLGIDCCFLVARPWAPWPLYHVPRWKEYGPENPLVNSFAGLNPAINGRAKLTVRQVRYLRPPGLWFRLFEGQSMAAALAGRAGKWHRENPFDIVMGISMNPDAEAAVAIGKKLNLPVATVAIGSDVMVLTRRLRRLWTHLGNTLEQVDLPVGVSESICRKLLETGKCKREPLCVYLGRDVEKFCPPEDKTGLRKILGWPVQAIVAVYVGAVIKTKGINELTIAAEQLLDKFPNFKLVCIGSGSEMDELIQLKQRIGLNGAIELAGQVDPDDVPAYLKASDFLVLPSHSEGMPQAVLEAMNCGLPVVATKVGGIPEAVIDGRTGILVSAKNARQLAKAMEKMIIDEQFRLSAAKESLAHSHKVFDPRQNAQKFAEALRSLKPRRQTPRKTWG